MSEFTYAPPEPTTFLHTLRKALEASKKSEVSAMLIGAAVEFSCDDQFSSRRSHEYQAELRVQVKVEAYPKFTDKIRAELLSLANDLMPRDVGYYLSQIAVTPFFETPPDDDMPLPNAALVKGAATIEHDGLQFRSKTEIRVYDALKKHRVLLFPNATAVLGGKTDDPKLPNKNKREPDFLLCLDGKWGILEVMGERYHPAVTAMKDHDRGRLFDDHGVRCIHFYDAHRCYNDPEGVASDFLGRLAKS
jgi:hypothetical protein